MPADLSSIADPSTLEPHPLNERIYDDADSLDDGLLSSIQEHGILESVIVTPDRRIISGHRRVAAAEKLGFAEIPILVRDFDSELAVREAIIECNNQREKTYSQRMREADELERIERERAKSRQGHRTDLRDDCPGGQDAEYGRTRDKVAAKIGSTSGKTYSKERLVWEAAASGDRIAKHEVSRLDRGTSRPHGAWRKVRSRQREDTPENTDEESNRTLDLVLSAHVGSNADVFCKVLDLHVEPGAIIADVTYGNGSFWAQVPARKYELRLTDINPDRSPDTEEGVNYRNLPYGDDSIDAVILDPPYLEGFYDGNRSASESDYHIKERYADATSGEKTYHEAVLHEYAVAGREAQRVLVDGGKLIVKLQDEVSRNRQRLTHIEVTNEYEQKLGFTAEDLFVVVRDETPTTGKIKRQRRARKNHSYFMVFVS